MTLSIASGIKADAAFAMMTAAPLKRNVFVVCFTLIIRVRDNLDRAFGRAVVVIELREPIQIAIGVVIFFCWSDKVFNKFVRLLEYQTQPRTEANIMVCDNSRINVYFMKSKFDVPLAKMQVCVHNK